MVAPPNISLRGMLGRGGKSELHRARWSVIRTAPPCEIGLTAISQGRVRKVPQKVYRPVEKRGYPFPDGRSQLKWFSIWKRGLQPIIPQGKGEKVR